MFLIDHSVVMSRSRVALSLNEALGLTTGAILQLRVTSSVLEQIKILNYVDSHFWDDITKIGIFDFINFDNPVVQEVCGSF